MKFGKKLLALVLCSTMLFIFTACNIGGNNSKKQEVEAAIGEFEYACQTSDVDAMLACLDTGFSQSLKSGRLLLNWMSTASDTDAVIMDTMLLTLLNISDITVDMETMQIEIKDITLEDEVASVESVLTMDCSEGTYKDNITIRMFKDTDRWYISGITT